MKWKFLLVLNTCVLVMSCKDHTKQLVDSEAVAVNPLEMAYTVVKRFPHDTVSFTEGLLVHNGQLFESTGHTDSYPSSRSLFGVFDTITGKILVKAAINSKKYFGEGIVFFKDKIYQLTDTTHIGFVYDTGSYKQVDSFHYTGEGWGLTSDNGYILMSDGSSNISYRAVPGFNEVKKLNVADNNGPVSNINELEMINGFIYANQWLSNYIIKIDTASGRVVGRLDLGKLAREAKSDYAGAAEMNGIAFDPAANRIYITGKCWPKLYEISFGH